MKEDIRTMKSSDECISENSVNLENSVDLKKTPSLWMVYISSDFNWLEDV